MQGVFLLFSMTVVRVIKRFSDWILYTSVFAALCAVSLSIATERLILGLLPNKVSALHVFIAGCTLMVYNFHFVLLKPHARPNDRYRWIHQNRIWHYIIFFTGCLLSGISIFFLSWKILAGCAVLGMLSFMYTLPLLPSKTIRIRDFGWLKITTLTLVWTIVTSVLPILYWNKSLLDFPFEIALRFVFMFVLCMAFDIRDMQADLSASINTLPNIIGTNNSYRLMDGITVLFCLLCFVQYFRYPSYGRLIAELITALAMKCSLLYSRKHGTDKVYLGLVDGIMLLYGCLVAFLSDYH